MGFYSLTTTSIYLPLVLLTLTNLSRATLFLQELQAIAEFPPTCEAAYQAPIKACPSAKDFSLTNTGSTSICSQDCYNSLAQASLNIQRACQGTSAPPGTVIAHAFVGDLPYFLCTPSGGSGSGSGAGSPSASSPNPGTSSPSGQASSSGSSTGSAPSSNPAASSSAISSNTASITSASSSSSSSSALSSTSSSQSSQTLTKSTKSSTSTASSKTTSSPSSTSESPRPTVSINNGSPFDQAVPNSSSRLHINSIGTFTLGIILISTFAIGHRFI